MSIKVSWLNTLNFIKIFSRTSIEPDKESRISTSEHHEAPQHQQQQQQTLQVQEGTELITLNPNVHFIKTDAVLGSTAQLSTIIVQGNSGQIQYAIQPDLAGQNMEGQPIYFTGNSYPVDHGASQAAQILSAFKFEDLYHNPPQAAKLVTSSAGSDYSTLSSPQPTTIQYVLTSSDMQIVQQSGSHVLLQPVNSHLQNEQK